MSTAPEPTGLTAGPELADSIDRALADATTRAPGHVRDRILLEALLPSGPASTGPARTLLVRRGGVVLGSRGAGPGHTHPALFLAGSRETWERAAAWFDAHPTPRRLAGFALAEATVRTDAEIVDGAWEATLHPDLVASTADAMVPAGPDEVAAFARVLADVGGSIARPPRTSGALTYLSVRLPSGDAATRLRTYQPLRALRPMARLGLR